MVQRPVLRDVLAETTAASIIGNGTWGKDRWQALAADDNRRLFVVRVVMREVPDSVVTSTGLVDTAVKAAVQSLLDRDEEVA